MAISFDPTTRDAVTAAFRQALAGKLHVPVLGIVVGYVAAEFAAMKAVDKGVELSATWVAPVVLVPSAL